MNDKYPFAEPISLEEIRKIFGAMVAECKKPQEPMIIIVAPGRNPKDV